MASPSHKPTKKALDRNTSSLSPTHLDEVGVQAHVGAALVPRIDVGHQTPVLLCPISLIDKRIALLRDAQSGAFELIHQRTLRFQRSITCLVSAGRLNFEALSGAKKLLDRFRVY